MRVAISGFFLAWVQHGLRLTAPGVKIANLPLRGEKGSIIAQKSVVLPPNVAGFISDEPPITQAEISVLPPDTTFGRRRYRTEDGFSALVTTILMGTDRTSIHTPDFCIRGQGWQITRSEKVTIPIEKPSKYDLEVLKVGTTISVELDGKRRQFNGVFIYWFVADGHLTASREERLWLSARELLTKARLQRWAYISYFSACLPGQEAACTQRLISLIQETVPEFQLSVGNNSGRMSASTQSAVPDRKS